MSKKKPNYGNNPKERDHNRSQGIGSRGNFVQDVVRSIGPKGEHSRKGENHGIKQRK